MLAKKSASKKSTARPAKKGVKKSVTAKKPSASKKSKVSKKRTASRSAPKTVPAQAAEPRQIVTKEIIVEKPCYHEPTEEHRVFSHVMYILFLVAAAGAAFFTFAMWQSGLGEEYYPFMALVLLGWAYFFKTFAHRIHHPHH